MKLGSNRNNRKLKGGANQPGGNNAGGNVPPPPGGNNAPPPPGGNNAPPPPGGNNAPPPPGGNIAGNKPPGGNNAGNKPPGGNNAGNKPPGENNAGNNKNIGNKTKEMVNETASKIKNTVGSATNSIKDYTNIGKLSNSVAAVGNVNKYLIILFAGVALVAFMYLLRYIVIQYYNNVNKSPYLISGTKTGKHTVVIYQDPESINYIPINRSENEDGMEFTYSFWMLIMDVSYRPGQWKHLFHKGGATSYPNRFQEYGYILLKIQLEYI